MMNLYQRVRRRSAPLRPPDTSTSSSSTRRTARSTRSYRRIFEYFDGYLLGLTATPGTTSTSTPINCSTSKPVCPPTTTASMRQSKTATSCRRRHGPYRWPSRHRGIRYDDLSDEGEAAVGVSRLGRRCRRRRVPRHRRRRSCQPLAIQHRHRRQGPRSLDDPRPPCRWRRPARQDNRVRRTSATPTSSPSASTSTTRSTGQFAAVITHAVSHGEDLIEKFSQLESMPQIAVSVDMLDTGIDIPMS